MGLALSATVDLPDELVDPDVDEFPFLRRSIFSNISYGRFADFRFDVAFALGVRPYARRSFFRQGSAPLPTGGREFWHHSDCDGTWTARECAAIAVLLERYIRSERAAADHLHRAEHLLYCLDVVVKRGGSVEFH